MSHSLTGLPHKGRDVRKKRGHSTRQPVDSMTPPPEHILMEEEARLKSSCNPCKGGSFELALGARIVIPEGLVSKKDAITCRVVPPGQRWQHNVCFPDEHLTSEVFVLSGNVQCKDKKIQLLLPHYRVTEKMMELNVKGRWNGGDAWVDVGFVQKSEDPPLVELELDRLGTFVVTFRHRQEVFTVTPNGCLYNPRLYKHMSIRFPKKGIHTTVNYTVRVHVVPEETVQFVKRQFPLECADLQRVTEIIDILPDVHCDFRRPSTIRLPLPEGVVLKEGAEAEGEESNDIFVLHKTNDGWDPVESRLKFTRGTVAFELKNPSRLCVVKSKPERDRKMREALRVLEQQLGRGGGEVSVFLSLMDKSWMVVADCYPETQAAARRRAREQQGCSLTERLQAPVAEVTWPPRRHAPKKEARAMSRVELWDGLTWTMELKGDLQWTGDSHMLQNSELQYFRYLPASYRNFLVEPAGHEQRPLVALLTLHPVGVEDASLREALTFNFHLHIPEERVVMYRYVEPEPVTYVEPTKPEPQLSLELPAARPAVRPIRQVRSCDVTSAEVLERLSRPTRRAPRVETRNCTISNPDGAPARRPLYTNPKNNTRVEREAKVISGRSLMTLSKIVNEGLTLAVHLDLPDTVITGIGFDALAQGNSMSDITYRILLQWKRLCADRGDGAVQQLAEALCRMRKPGVADVLLEQHRHNKELTSDCFLQAAVSGVYLG